MANQHTINGFTAWTLAAGDGATQATFIPELGAIGSSLILPGPDGAPRQTLFQHDFFWDRDTELTRGGLPFLFPVCGRLERGGQAETYLYDGHLYQLKIHGFAHRMAWQVTDRAPPDQLEMTLTDTDESRMRYPFAFEIRLRYRVEPGLLTGEQRTTNRGDRPLPYYAGFHPYFLTPPPGEGKDAVCLELTPARFLAYNERRTDLIGEQRGVPPFPVRITDPGINEQLIRMGPEKEACLSFPDGFRLHLRADSDTDADRFPYIQLYTMPDKPFFCVEPWMGFPNALNTVAGVRWLAPGQTETARLRIATA